MKSDPACSRQQFLKDVSAHVMHVALDQDAYRHLSFRAPGTLVHSFQITTWPGHLAVSGDMGSWVFSRLRDMFEFFRDDRDEPRINPGYWSEKLVAENVRSGATEYSHQQFVDRIDERVKEWLEEDPSAAKNVEASEAVADLKRAGAEDEYAARLALRDFEEVDGLNFDDCHTEWRLSEYTFHFLWACYAIAWAVRQYDSSKEPVLEVSHG